MMIKTQSFLKNTDLWDILVLYIGLSKYIIIHPVFNFYDNFLDVVRSTDSMEDSKKKILFTGLNMSQDHHPKKLPAMSLRSMLEHTSMLWHFSEVKLIHFSLMYILNMLIWKKPECGVSTQMIQNAQKNSTLLAQKLYSLGTSRKSKPIIMALTS